MACTHADILKTATDWARAEMVSSAFFVLFGVLFLGAGWGFFQLGKTGMAKAFPLPLVVAGGLLLVLGAGLFLQNYGRVTGFAAAFDSDPAAFVTSQIADAERVLKSYAVTVFRAIPLICAFCAVLIPFLAGNDARARLIVVLAMLAVILIVDVNSNARLETYRAALLRAAQPG